MAVEVDVAVIGGGIAGISVAGELGATHTVAVLEQEAQLAYHASGRSAAAFLESYGGPEIRALTRAARPIFGELGERLLTGRPLLWVAGAGDVGRLEQLVAAEPSLRALEPAQAREYCPALRESWLAAAAAEDGAQDLDVAALFDAYRQLALRRGVHIMVRAAVHSGREDGAGWWLDTAAGGVRAAVVVNAAGAWADEVAQRCGVAPVGLAPLRRTVAIVASSDVDASWPLVCEIGDAFYFRPESGGLLLSPADETPSPPTDARADTVDIALALERASEATTLSLRHVRASWAGLRTFSPDRNPVVGLDPAHRGFYWLAGQGGYGMQTAPAMARLAAALVRGGVADRGGDEAPPLGLAEVARRLSPDRYR